MFFNIFYIIFSICSIFCLLGSILSRNTVHSILYLVLIFCNVSGMLLLLNIDYIAFIYMIVYIGAIAVLFLFVIMMLNVKLLEVNESFLSAIPLGFFIGLFFLFECFLVLKLTNGVFYFILNIERITKDSDIFISFLDELKFSLNVDFFNYLGFFDTEFLYTDWLDFVVNYEIIDLLGSIMYSYYVIPFILSSFILFVAMIGSILLTLHESQDSKKQQLFKQVTRIFDDSIMNK